MTITDEMRAAVPFALYACIGDCEHVWPAAELRWWRDGFYCTGCIDEMAPHPDDLLGPPEDHDEQWDWLWDKRHDGPSLATVLADRATRCDGATA